MARDIALCWKRQPHCSKRRRRHQEHSDDFKMVLDERCIGSTASGNVWIFDRSRPHNADEFYETGYRLCVTSPIIYHKHTTLQGAGDGVHRWQGEGVNRPAQETGLRPE